MHEQANFSLDDFGKLEHQDPLLPVNMLMVLMGFSLLIFNRAIENIGDLYTPTSLVSGATFFIAYMLYLSDYHEKIWIIYFSLETDRMFFRIYGIMLGLIVITLIPNYPNYWYFYVNVAFFVMYLKKRNTSREYIAAFHARYTSFSDCTDDKVIAKYLLSKKFTANFFTFGFLLSLVTSLVLFLMHRYKPAPIYISELDFRLNLYSVVSALIVVPIVFFWCKKIRTGLKEIVDMIEDGNVEYFKSM